MTMTETLGQRISQRRRMLSLSQEAFGEKMGVSRQAISKWESDAAVPEVDRLIEMSKLFGVSVGWLLGTECEDDTPFEEPVIPIAPTFPEPQASQPDPEPESQPTQESEPPASRPFAWIAVVCCVVSVASLILSIIAFSRPMPELPTQMAQLSEEDKAYLVSVQQDLEYLKIRNEALYEGLIERNAELSSIQDELAALQTYVYSMPQASGLVSGLTKYEQFDSWNLVGDLDSSLSSVNLVFSCRPFNIRLTEMWFHIKQGSTTVERFNCGYYKEKNLYFADFSLPVDNGYSYEVELVYDDGRTEQFELTGHGMSDLKDAAMPQIQSAERLPSDGGALNIRYSNLTLSGPPLLPKYLQYSWIHLRLVHYHNGVAVAEHDLTDWIKELYRQGDTLSFSIAEQTFSMIDSKQGSIHEIRLEGDLKITAGVNGWEGDPIYYDYSVVLEKWKNTGNQLQRVEE